MSKLEEIERDLREYFEKEPNLTKQDRLAYLMTIFAKRLEFNKLEHVINYTDLFHVISDAKTNFVRMRVPIKISNKTLEPSEVTHIALLEAFIGHLNYKGVLKKLVKFDYKE